MAREAYPKENARYSVTFGKNGARISTAAFRALGSPWPMGLLFDSEQGKAAITSEQGKAAITRDNDGWAECPTRAGAVASSGIRAPFIPSGEYLATMSTINGVPVLVFDYESAAKEDQPRE